MSDFPGTEHYKEIIELFERVLEKRKPNDLIADAQIMVSCMKALCDHIDEQQAEIESLQDLIERAKKQLCEGLDMYDHDMMFYGQNALEVLEKASAESREEKPS